VAVNDTLLSNVSLEERSARIGISLPIRVSRNVHSTSFILGVNGDYRWLRVIDSDSDPLTDFDRRVTVTPTALLAYKLQTNIRDIIPNSGLLITSTSEIDAFTSDRARPSRAWRTDLNWFLPFLKQNNQGIRLSTGVLWQNRGSVLNVDTFLPRGYEDDVFLGAGTFLKAGFEFVQPLAYVDQGLVLLPISLEAIYLFGFGEGLVKASDFDVTYSSVGVGVGVTTRLFHNVRVDARFALARLIEEGGWSYSFR
jgi:hypothetical protein